MFRLIFVVSAHLCALVASATLRGASAVELLEMREDIAKCLPLIASGGAQARSALFSFPLQISNASFVLLMLLALCMAGSDCWIC